MCGITAFFARESRIDYKHLDTLFIGAERRGQDGFGFVIIKRDVDSGQRKIECVMRTAEPYSQCKDLVRTLIDEVQIGIGDMIIAISRAAPETEPATDPANQDETLQPIINKDTGLVVVHNGAVSQKIYNELKTYHEVTVENKLYKYNSVIDSEAIAASYIAHDRNMKEAMEHLSGGFAALLYDETKDMLYVVNDFKPIAHAYIRGVGFFLHSDNGVLGDIVYDVTGCSRDGIAMWETWYHHYLGGGRIKEIDLDSGFIRNIKYSPRYMTQNWDSNNPKNHNPELHASNDSIKMVYPNEPLCMVAASGGLDSSLTLSILKLAGYHNIVACHFDYGHRGAEAEKRAIQNVCKELNVECHIVDIKEQMLAIDKTSMLTDPNAKITTGTTEGLKKLDAWVNCRNMQFLTWMCTLAEAKVMQYEFPEVYFLGGFLNLSESGHYPDNSEYFLDAFLNFAKYGSLIGNRIKPLYALSNLMKHELFVLIKEFGLENVYRHTISCDRPIVECRNTRMRDTIPQTENEIPGKEFVADYIPCNCSKNGMPACGSGLLSYWGSKMVGMNDMELRNYYEVDDPDYIAHIPGHIKDQFNKIVDVEHIINRILLPTDKLTNLRLCHINRKDNK